MNKNIDNKKNSALRKKDREEQVARYFKYGFIGLIVVIVLSIALTLYFTDAASYIATVGSERISTAEFKSYVKQVKDKMLSEAKITAGTPEADNFWSTATFNGLSAIDEAKRQAMDLAKEQKIKVIKAKEQKIQLTKDEQKQYIDATVDQIMSENNNDKAAADKYLMDNIGADLKTFKKMYAEILLGQKLDSSEESSMNVTDEDLQKEYDDNTKAYDTVTVRHILFATVDLTTGAALSDDKKKEAETKANDILARVKAGEDMEALAKEFSDDKPAVDTNGGEYSFNKYGKYASEFMDWALSKANVGDVDIVTTDYGYHVMRLEKREATPLDQVKDSIKSEKQQSMYNDLVEQWKKDPKYDVKKKQSMYDAIK